MLLPTSEPACTAPPMWCPAPVSLAGRKLSKLFEQRMETLGPQFKKERKKKSKIHPHHFKIMHMKASAQEGKVWTVLMCWGVNRAHYRRSSRSLPALFSCPLHCTFTGQWVPRHSVGILTNGLGSRSAPNPTNPWNQEKWKATISHRHRLVCAFSLAWHLHQPFPVPPATGETFC